jgi:hypothetical protein
MPKRNNIPEADQVRERFIRSFEELRYRGIVKTKTEFCKSVGLCSTSNLIRMKNKQLEPGVNSILLLNKKYGVSIDWIFFEKGNVLENENE